MTTYKGKVFKVYDRQWQGKVLYSIKIDGDPLYHRLNGAPPADVGPGSYVVIEADANSDGKSTKVKSVTVQKEEPRAASGSASSPAAGSYAARDVSIQYQSARKDALLLVQIAVAAGAVKLPAKEAAKLKALETMVDAYTASFYEDIGTLGAVARANGTEVAETAEPPEETEDE